MKAISFPGLAIGLAAFIASLTLTAAGQQNAPSERIWLGHRSVSPHKLVVNWETDEPGESIVEYGATAELGNKTARADRAAVTLHHVEIPIEKPAEPLFYRVKSGARASAVHRFGGYPTDGLKVAIVADLGYAKQDWAPALVKESPHLLMTAGDNVGSLHDKGREGTKAFSALIDKAPKLFQTTPFMPVLGNHDREIKPRGPKPPAEAVYDIEADAYRSFFELPGDEWKWHFDLPGVGARFAALDLNHLGDFGTTWQTCHPYSVDSEQFKWYEKLIGQSADQPFLITLYNEQNSRTRNLEKGAWGKLISQGTLAITGFGYFAERAEVDGFQYYNTSVSGKGAQYKDSKSAFLKGEDNYMLLTFSKGKALTVEIKSLAGEVLERREFKPRQGPGGVKAAPAIDPDAAAHAQPEAALETFLARLATSDMNGAYALVAPSSRKSGDPIAYQSPLTFEAFQKEAAGNPQKFGRYRLGEKREEKAGVMRIWVHFEGGDNDETMLVKEAGKWYVADPIHIIR